MSLSKKTTGLGKKNDTIIKRVKWSRSRLPPTRIARDGSIMEWAEDFQDPEITHRHISHLFGLFPGHTISLEKTPDLCKALAYCLIKRGGDGPAWSTVWKIATWAHLLNTEHAYHMIKHLIVLFDSSHDHEFNNNGGLYGNLFSRHPPIQLDGNFGFSAAIAEMLVQSTMEDLYLLPALPRDKWANGCVKGLKARGEVTVNICWKEGNLHEVGLWSRNQNSKIRLHYGGTKVYTFPASCYDGCPASGCETRMFEINIPYFKQAIVMASTCDSCGYRSSEVQASGTISEKGKKLTLYVKNVNDLSRDVMKTLRGFMGLLLEMLLMKMAEASGLILGPD